MTESSFRQLCVDDLGSDQIEQWFRRGVVLLVGSWISSCGPFVPPDTTPLPHGVSWNKTIWEQFFGWSCPEHLRQLSDDFKQLPFEAIMQCYQGRSELRSLLRRLYGGRAHNNLHDLLVTALGTRRIQRLITTNYDLGLDDCIRPAHRIATIHDQATCAAYRALADEQYAPYYKIHGTALEGHEDNLVCDLGSERRLTGWKADLLQDCVRDRTLLIVGYSGRDFDLCPELTWRTRQAETVWLTYHRDDLSPMARQLLTQRQGVAVVGHGKTFLEKVFEQPLSMKPGTDQPPAMTLQRSLIADWRLRLLNWMAAGELVEPYLDDFVGTEAEKAELRASIQGHLARYRDAARTYAEALKTRRITPGDKARLELGKAGAWFIYGAYLRSLIALSQAHRIIATMLKEEDLSRLRKHPSKLSRRICQAHQDLLGRLHEAQLVIYMRFKELTESVGLRPLANYCLLRARRRYGQAKAILERSGAHERLQAVQHNAQCLGIERRDGLALPIDPGYGNLGLTAMEVIAHRDHLRAMKDPWSSEDRSLANECLRKADYYGWHHEAWKFCWLLMWHTPRSDAAQYLAPFRFHFARVQKPLLATIFSLRRNCGIVDASTLRKSFAIYAACTMAALGPVRVAPFFPFQQTESRP
jgi:tetratricopeptide (TPR) repeat protein